MQTQTIKPFTLLLSPYPQHPWSSTSGMLLCRACTTRTDNNQGISLSAYTKAVCQYQRAHNKSGKEIWCPSLSGTSTCPACIETGKGSQTSLPSPWNMKDHFEALLLCHTDDEKTRTLITSDAPKQRSQTLFQALQKAQIWYAAIFGKNVNARA